MSDRRVVIAAGLSLAVSAALIVRVILIGKPEVVSLLVPPVVGALVALSRPTKRWALVLAVVLTVPTAVLSLIGGIGLLYVPSIILLAWSAARPSSPPATSP